MKRWFVGLVHNDPLPPFGMRDCRCVHGDCDCWLTVTNRGFDFSIWARAWSWPTQKVAEAQAVAVCVQDPRYLGLVRVVKSGPCLTGPKMELAL